MRTEKGKRQNDQHRSNNQYSFISISTLTAILGSKTVDGVISLRLLADKTREGIGSEATSVATAGIDITNVDLDRGVILGSDQTVCGGALGRKKERKSSVLINHIHS